MGHLRGGAVQPVSWLTVFHALRLECVNSMLSTASAQGDCLFCSGRESNFSEASLVSVPFGQHVGRRDRGCCIPHPSTEYVLQYPHGMVFFAAEMSNSQKAWNV